MRSDSKVRVGSGNLELGWEDPLRPTSRISAYDDELISQPLQLGYFTFNGVPEVLSGAHFITGIAATMLGAGVVSIPIIATICGSKGIIVALLLSGFVSLSSGITLINVTDITKATSFEGICSSTVKNFLLYFCLSDLSLILLTSLASTAYVLMIAGAVDSLFRAAGLSISNIVTLLISSGLCAPMCFLRSYNQLKAASNFTTWVFLATIGIILWKTIAYDGPIDYQEPVPTLGGFMLGCSQLATAFLAHFNIPGLYAECRRDVKPKVGLYLAIAMLAAVTLYGALAIVCVNKFGLMVGPDMLKTLSDLNNAKDVVLLATQFLVAAGLCVKSPLVNFPIKTVLSRYRGIDIRTCSTMDNVLVTLASRGLILVLTLFLTRIDTVLQFAGATAGSAILLIGPGVFGLISERGVLAKLRNIDLVITGVLLTSISIYFLVAS